MKADTITNTVKGWRYNDVDLLAYIDDVYDTEPRLAGLCLGCLKNSLSSSPNILKRVKRLIVCYILGADKNTFTKIISNLINECHQYIENETCQCSNDKTLRLSDLNPEDMEFSIGDY